jgi:hypothetical protein
VKNGEQVGSCHMKHKKSKRTSPYAERAPTAGAIFVAAAAKAKYMATSSRARPHGVLGG